MGKIYTAMGLMSGTSLDGVDVSIIKSDGDREFSSILDSYFEYDQDLIEKILKIREKITNPEGLNRYLDEIKSLEREITLFHVKAVNETLQMSKSNVDLIGFHGQTIFHDPEKKILNN
jgi:Predicted molecular chaperone distantly related to HSP70-fold metalloproteases